MKYTHLNNFILSYHKGDIIVLDGFPKFEQIILPLFLVPNLFMVTNKNTKKEKKKTNGRIGTYLMFCIFYWYP